MRSYKIYPKQFRTEKIAIEKKRCFFIMPFSEEFNIVYGEMKTALTREGYTCVRVDEISGSTPIINKILCEMLKAQYIIADLTNCNPNVFYELGVAHTFKDAENIILLKQAGSKVPFDITHLTYLEYSQDNFYYLTSKLKKALADNNHITDFYDVLNVRGMIDYCHDNQDEFIEILKECLSEDITRIIDLFNYSENISSSEIQSLVKRFSINIKSVLNQYDTKIHYGILNFYFEMLLVASERININDVLNTILSDYFNTTSIDTLLAEGYITDMTIKFARAEKQLQIVMPWIVSYFRRSKSGTIDLNRYKLESFLLTTQSKEINSIISNAITDENVHIREHFADIIGEKRLYHALPLLQSQLHKEKNYYTATSFIDAISKIGDKFSLSHILSWLEDNYDELYATKRWSVFSHVKRAIVKLDSQQLESFNCRYGACLPEKML